VEKNNSKKIIIGIVAIVAILLVILILIKVLNNRKETDATSDITEMYSYDSSKVIFTAVKENIEGNGGTGTWTIDVLNDNGKVKLYYKIIYSYEDNLDDEKVRKVIETLAPNTENYNLDGTTELGTTEMGTDTKVVRTGNDIAIFCYVDVDNTDALTEEGKESIKSELENQGFTIK